MRQKMLDMIGIDCLSAKLAALKPVAKKFATAQSLNRMVLLV
jgi:hypothetical protein